MHAARGVDEHQVDAARPGGLEGVEDDAGRVAALLAAQHGDADPVAPGLELLGGCGAEGVGGDEQDPLAGPVAGVGELGRGGGLADPVDADQQPHAGLPRVGVQGPVGLLGELVGDLGFEERGEVVGVADPGLAGPVAHRVEQPRGGG